MTLLDLIHTKMQETLTSKGKVSLALSGGSSPVALYEELSTYDLDWSKVTLTLIDDRQVDADHPDSNQLLISQTLRQHNAIAHISSHLINGLKIVYPILPSLAWVSTDILRRFSRPCLINLRPFILRETSYSQTALKGTRSTIALL